MDTLLTEPSTPRAPLGRSVGRYQLLEVLGRGGMGTVYRARQEQLQKLVALKLLDPLRASKPGAVTRFLREARAASQIRHPNVVQVFDVGFDEGNAFLVMELLEGHDLAAHLKLRGRLALEEALELLAPVLGGVRAAHEAGVVHRDLKPSNIFLARRGRTLTSPVVLDFGVSRLLDDEELGNGSLTSADALLGTAAYVAPEQAKHARSADDRSDQYALGVILYECVTGQRPFRGNSTLELLHAIATAEVAPPSELNPSLPREFDQVVLRAMARAPDQRFTDLNDLASAVMQWAAPQTWLAWGRELEAEQTGAGQGVSPLRGEPSGQPRRRPRAWMALAGSFLLGAASAGALAAGVSRCERSANEHPSSVEATRAKSATESPPPPAPTAQEPVPSAATSKPVAPSVQPAAPRLSNRSASPKPQRSTAASQRSTPIELGSNDAPILQ